MDYRLLLKTSITAGEILLESGAETRRVQDTMKRMLETSKMDHTEAAVIAMSIIVTLSDKNFPALTLLSHIKERGSCFVRISKVNTISRKYCGGEITIEEAYEMLLKIKNYKEYNDFFISISMLAIGGFFPLLIGGSVISSVISVLNALVTSITKHFCLKYKFGNFITNIVVCFSATIIPLVILPLFGDSFETEIIITAGIMPLVPGVAITNAVRDTLDGDYVSGGARVLEGLVKVFSIAIGVALGLIIFK